VEGRCWYSPDLALAVETFYELSVSSRSTTVRRSTPKGTNRVAGATNRVVVLEAEEVTESTGGAPAALPPNVVADASVMITTNKSTSQWHTSVKLVEIENLE
jgi:hypothetical protein